MIKTTIEQRINKKLTPSLLFINDFSHQHAGHYDPAQHGGTHFDVTVVSDAFLGLSKIKRHQMIYALLDDLMNNPIHALQLTTLTPAEHQAKAATDQG